VFVRRLQRREIYLSPVQRGQGACVSLFTATFQVLLGRLLLSFDGQSRPRQGAREPNARTGPDANILPQDRYTARGLCAAMDAEADPM
jgi:hypothetical protein